MSEASEYAIKKIKELALKPLYSDVLFLEGDLSIDKTEDFKSFKESADYTLKMAVVDQHKRLKNYASMHMMGNKFNRVEWRIDYNTSMFDFDFISTKHDFKHRLCITDEFFYHANISPANMFVGIIGSRNLIEVMMAHILTSATGHFISNPSMSLKEFRTRIGDRGSFEVSSDGTTYAHMPCGEVPEKITVDPAWNLWVNKFAPVPVSQADETSHYLNKKSHDLPGVNERVKHPIDGYTLSIREIIMTLNDKHRWTREQIADWLDKLQDDGIVDLSFKEQQQEEGSE